jgi:Fe-S cluster assembly iron-binding protein IscA
VLEITDEAAAVLERAYDAAGRFNPGVKIRVYRSGDQVQLGFADRPADGDEVVPVGDMLIFVQGDIAGTLEAQQPHDRLVVRELG